MYVVIVGGGKVGTYLTRRLLKEGKEVLLIERDRSQYKSLHDQFGDAVMWGDGCEASTQSEAGFQRADVVAAVTGEDEDNLIVCQMAKNEFGVSRTVARVNDPTHTWLFEKLGVTATVSATDVLYSLIEQEILLGKVIPLATVKLGNMGVVEASLTPRSACIGKRVRDLNLPKKTNIVWLVRGDEGTTVDGDTEFQAGDLIVALVPLESEAEFRSLL